MSSVKHGPEQLVGVRVLVVALLGVAAPDRRPDGLDDDDLAALLCAHAGIRLDWLRRLTGRGRPTSQSSEGAGVDEQLGIAGSGAIATGSRPARRDAGEHDPVGALGRVGGARAKAIAKACERLGEGYDAANVTVITDLDALADATFLVEAIAEDTALKSELLGRLGALADADAVLARRPRRCRSPSSPRPPAARSASSACTSSTRSRR